MNKQQKFELGQLVATPGALESIPPEEMRAAIVRHASGDWGELCKEDCRENEFALTRRLRLMSAYRTQGGTKFWIITEADRSVTTVLLPSEY